MRNDTPHDEAPETAEHPLAPSVTSMVESIVGCKWSVALLQLIVDDTRRPSELLRGCPGLSTKVMNERLAKMTRFGVLTRTVIGEKPPLEVRYDPTPLGCRFTGLLDEVRRLQSDVDAGEVTGTTPPRSMP